MRLWRCIAAAAAVGSLAAVAPAEPAAKKARPAAAARDWAKVVVATPAGGFLMGNPNASVKLVEYGSQTCPHCAQFAAAAKAPLEARVRTGKVSFEYRNFVLNGADVAASLVARCGGTATFFPLTNKLFATQRQWVAKITGIPEAEKVKLQSMTDGQRLAAFADLGGITAIAASSGLAPARAKVCLADPAALARLGTMHEAAAALGVTGTPTFFINGTKVEARDWSSLEPLIRSAGG